MKGDAPDGICCARFKSNKHPVMAENFKQNTEPPESPNSKMPSFNFAGLYLKSIAYRIREVRHHVMSDQQDRKNIFTATKPRISCKRLQ